MNPSLSNRAINRQHWLEHIRAWEQSGLTQQAFCKQHHLGPASFQRWRRISMMEETPKELSPVTFLPVSVMDTRASNLTLWVNEYLRLEISAGFDPTTLKQVIQVLQT